MSEPRHHPRQGLVQIANELAAHGLCLPLLCPPGTPSESIFRSFRERLGQASKKLQEVNRDALLVVLIDAADNAEMVAREYNERSLARSLANALRTSEELVGLGQGYWDDEDHVVSPFDLRYWIEHPDESGGRLDDFDPRARQIQYPPARITAQIVRLLGLSVDSENREWRLPGRNEPALLCEIWSDKNVTEYLERDQLFRSGMRMNAKIEILKTLCRKTNKSLIVSVSIDRHIHQYYVRSDENSLGYIPPSRKVFVFSADGVLEDARKSYQPR